MSKSMAFKRNDTLHNDAGMCRLSDGSKYVGSWKQGKRNGHGRCIYASGDQYEGQWDKDVRCGKGGCVYVSGDKYKGQQCSIV